jgi:hypothetical protein
MRPSVNDRATRSQESPTLRLCRSDRSGGTARSPATQLPALLSNHHCSAFAGSCVWTSYQHAGPVPSKNPGPHSVNPPRDHEVARRVQESARAIQLRVCRDCYTRCES